MLPSTNSRRHFLLVDRRFQLKYLGIFALLGALVAVGGAATGWAASTHRPWDLFFVGLLALLALIGSMAIGGACLIMTYRIAGPVYVMSRVLWTLAEGKYPTLRALRAEDELAELYELLRKSVDLLRSRELEETARLRQAVESLTAGATTPQTQEAIQMLEALCQRRSGHA